MRINPIALLLTLIFMTIAICSAILHNFPMMIIAFVLLGCQFLWSWIA